MERTRPPFACPCCGFRSLDCWGTAVCSICWWEIDCVDVADDKVSGGPNHGYSLNMARANFRAHGHMYSAERPINYLKRETPTRAAVMAYVRDVMDGQIDLEQRHLRALIEAEQATIRTPVSAPGREMQVSEEALLRAPMRGGES